MYLKRNLGYPKSVIISNDVKPNIMDSAELITYRNENNSLDLIQDWIFWTDYAESLVPKGKCSYFFLDVSPLK